VGDYSAVSAAFELWLVLRDFAPNFPALVSLYHDIVEQLGVDELKELIEHQAVILFPSRPCTSLTCNRFSQQNPTLNLRRRFTSKIKNLICCPRRRVSKINILPPPAETLRQVVGPSTFDRNFGANFLNCSSHAHGGG